MEKDKHELNLQIKALSSNQDNKLNQLKIIKEK